MIEYYYDDLEEDYIEVEDILLDHGNYKYEVFNQDHDIIGTAKLTLIEE